MQSLTQIKNIFLLAALGSSQSFAATQTVTLENYLPGYALTAKITDQNIVRVKSYPEVITQPLHIKSIVPGYIDDISKTSCDKIRTAVENYNLFPDPTRQAFKKTIREISSFEAKLSYPETLIDTGILIALRQAGVSISAGASVVNPLLLTSISASVEISDSAMIKTVGAEQEFIKKIKEAFKTTPGQISNFSWRSTWSDAMCDIAEGRIKINIQSEWIEKNSEAKREIVTLNIGRLISNELAAQVFANGLDRLGFGLNYARAALSIDDILKSHLSLEGEVQKDTVFKLLPRFMNIQTGLPFSLLSEEKLRETVTETIYTDSQRSIAINSNVNL